ncbi:hypothetical protein [Silvanigrella aquatica]|uniref:Uncharacterized protein n=1 Tax=Silvanigrella aquatica TaxID=1915309 RepID=A0A1L4D0D3_9BACT|nr:hypothetical protein [Silvanigrella aquatica]APJ03672.1 hypothetical protein AXG55_07030 [Silvanigrella aquatica]
MKKIQKIQKNCVQAFGNDFLYPQAGSKKSNDWFIFAASSNEIFEGHATEFFKVPTTFFASKG